MGRVIVAAIAGSVVYFVFNMASWMFLHVHDKAMHVLPQDEQVVTVFKQFGLTTGAYVYPMMSPNVDKAAFDKQFKEFEDKHRAGPTFSIFYSAEGAEVMAPRVMIQGFLMDLIAALIAGSLALVGAHAGCGYFGRAGIVASLGIFAAIEGSAALWNWMRFPLDWTLPMMFDVIVGWMLAGLVIAAIVRPVRAVVVEAARVP